MKITAPFPNNPSVQRPGGPLKPKPIHQRPDNPLVRALMAETTFNPPPAGISNPLYRPGGPVKSTNFGAAPQPVPGISDPTYRPGGSMTKNFTNGGGKGSPRLVGGGGGKGSTQPIDYSGMPRPTSWV